MYVGWPIYCVRSKDSTNDVFFLIGFIYIREYQITSHFHDYDRLIEELNHNFHVEADLNLRFTLC